MKNIKNIVFILIVMAFTLNAFAAFAMSSCVCSEMMQMEMEMSSKDMSCHDTVETDANTAQIDQDQSKLTECENCCSNCKISAPASILSKKPSTDFFSKIMEPIPHIDINSSIYPYGIDYPPKLIS